MSEPPKVAGVDARYQQIIDALPDFVYVVDRDLRIVLINQTLLNSLPNLDVDGNPLGRPMREVFPYLPPAVAQEIEGVFERGKLVTGSMEAEMPTSGSRINAEYHRLPLHGDDGEVRWVANLIRDRSEQRAAERALRAERDRARAILEAVPLPITISDLEAWVVDCNDRAWQEGGYPNKEAYLGRNGLDFVSEEHRPRALESMVRTFREGAVHGVPYRLLRVDGSSFPAELSAAVIRGDDGEPVGYVAVVKNKEQ